MQQVGDPAVFAEAGTEQEPGQPRHRHQTTAGGANRVSGSALGESFATAQPSCWDTGRVGCWEGEILGGWDAGGCAWPRHLHRKGGVENTREVVKRDRNCLEAGEGTLQWEC